MILNGCFRRGSSQLPPVKDWSMIRGDTKSFPVRGRNVPAGRTVTALYWTAKASPADADGAIKLQKTITLDATTVLATGTLAFVEADTSNSATVPDTIAYELTAVLDDNSTDTILTGTVTLTTRIPITMPTTVATMTVTAA